MGNYRIKANLNDWGKKLLSKSEIAAIDVNVQDLDKDIKDIVFKEYPKDLIDADSIHLEKSSEIEKNDVVKIEIPLVDGSMSVLAQVYDVNDTIIFVNKPDFVDDIFNEKIKSKDIYRRWVNDCNSLIFDKFSMLDCSAVKNKDNKWSISLASPKEAQDYLKDKEVIKYATTVLRMSTEMLLNLKYKNDSGLRYKTFWFLNDLFDSSEWKALVRKIDYMKDSDTPTKTFLNKLEDSVKHLTELEFYDYGRENF